MNKLVRRVTVVQGSGEHRQAKVAYESDDEDEDLEESPVPIFKPLERAVRHFLKAQVIAAQEAYQHHLESAKKGGHSWVVDDPINFMKARRKAVKEIRKASKIDFDDEDDGD